MSAPRKLTDEQIKEIREVFRLADRVRKQGQKPDQSGIMEHLSETYNISTRTIRRIRRPAKRKFR